MPDQQQQPQQQQQASFESQFADLAFTYLRDKAPKLMDFARGFQVLDKNEDETRAAGAFGFMVGKSWYIAPVFFMNGELKGHELLYIQDQDSFVPMAENWVNYLINRRPAVLGEVGNNQEVMQGMIRPDISVFSRSPLTFGKSGSMTTGYFVRGEPFEIRPFVRAFQRSVEDEAFSKSAAALDLREALKFIGEHGADVLLKTAQTDPVFAASLMEHYDPRDLIAAVNIPKSAAVLDGSAGDSEEIKDSKRPRTVNKSPAAITEGGSLEIIRGDDGGVLNLGSMPDEDRERLVSDGILIKDNRTGVSKVYNLDIPSTFTGPDGSGLYEVFVKPGKFERMLVIEGPKTIGKGATNTLVLVRVDEGGKVVLTTTKAVVVRKKLESTDWKKFWDALPEASSMTTDESYVLVNDNGEGTIPFTLKKREEQDGVTTWWVYPRTYTRDFGNAFSGAGASDHGTCCSYPEREHSKYPFVDHTFPSQDLNKPTHSVPAPTGADDNYDYEKANVRQLAISKKVNGFKIIGATLMAGDTVKALKVDAESNFGVVPGTLYDVQFSMFKEAGLEDLKIFGSGDSFEIQHTQEPAGHRLSKQAALLRLMQHYGVHHKEASVILDQVAAKGVQQYLLKRADRANMVGNSIMAPAMSILDNTQTWDASVGSPVQYDQQVNQRVQPLMYSDRSMYNPDTRLDRTSLMAAGHAAQTHRKDVFDTTTLAGLIKTMNSSDMTDKFLSDLMVGEDRIGRLLFMFYWHNDKVQDRYGKEEMSELESALRNTFKAVGDLILFLKKKSIEPDMAVRGSDVDLKPLTS